MIETSKKAHYLHHHIKLNAEFQEDIKWWLTYLPSWNGVSFLYEADWSSTPDVELFTDSNCSFGRLHTNGFHSKIFTLPAQPFVT